jgi:hypothetical protein
MSIDFRKGNDDLHFRNVIPSGKGGTAWSKARINEKLAVNRRLPILPNTSSPLKIKLAAAAIIMIAFVHTNVFYYLWNKPHDVTASPFSHGNQNDVRTIAAPVRRRFPRYGITAFFRECPWIQVNPPKANCTLFFRPESNGNEGLAQWTSSVVGGYINAQLMGCRLLVDYGKIVDLRQIVTAPMPLEKKEAIDWVVPKGFVCRPAQHCRTALSGQEHLPRVPNYRHGYKNITQLNIHRRQYQDLEMALPGFRIENGFACSWNSMFELAEAATQYELTLFEEILPKLRDPEALVLAVYVRTGFTDQAARAEKNGTEATINVAAHEKFSRMPTRCALQLEQDFLEGRKGDFPFSKIVWMLATDSVYVKKLVVDLYESKDVKAENKSVTRTVVTTSSRGKHSRPARSPSTADFAESMIDWFLIGESDAVVVASNGYTFPTTAAMRTNLPVYGRDCSLMTWLHDDE